ncbi:hypothetical protein, partial [Rhizobium ruizarguesonis]|uniref:hypothetical protein n=1 Tax=Rhizobium ruizarguesonis TaxID=2081791 RepID=UPI001952E0E5
IMFLRDERSLGVKNGTLGTLTAMGRSWMEVRLDDGQTLRFNRKDYADLTHGYAATIHRCRGRRSTGPGCCPAAIWTGTPPIWR